MCCSTYTRCNHHHCHRHRHHHHHHHRHQHHHLLTQDVQRDDLPDRPPAHAVVGVADVVTGVAPGDLPRKYFKIWKIVQ